MADTARTYVVGSEPQESWDREHVAHDQQAVFLEDGRQIGSYCATCLALYIIECPPRY